MVVRKSAPGWALPCVLFSALLCLSPVTPQAATPDQLTPGEEARALVAAEAWSFNGGTAALRFNTSLLEPFGLIVGAPGQLLTFREHDAVSAAMPIRAEGGIRFAARDGSLTRFVDGSIHVDGSFHVDLPDGSRLDYDGFEVRVSPLNPMHLDVIGNDGKVWFFVNHMMWETIDDDTRFHLRAADLNVTPALAARVGVPELAGNYVGELTFISPLRTRGPGRMGAVPITGDPTARGTPCVRGATPCFHGDAHPDGGIYEADVLMEIYSMSYSRCRRSSGSGTCDGTGPDDGEVVFTPSSTLRNSNRPNTADIPWYEKFTGQTNPWGYPYPHADQHPFLIWNLYRIVDDQLEQIAASGVKHAWLTTNTGCSAPFGGHMLSPNCRDTYGVGNNDAYDDLGPRSEIDPAGGWFGRCGSIFDTNCDGVSNPVSSNGFRDRLIVRESQLSVPGATYYSDSWYIVQDDIDIYNTMMHRTMQPVGGASSWTPGSQGVAILGPMINTWVDPQAHPARNVEIAGEEGRARVAVKVKELPGCPTGSGLAGTCWRYDYAVQNFDFARIVRGDPPNDKPPNLRIVSNTGYRSFSVPVGGAGVYLEPGHFADIDIEPDNNWTAIVDGDAVTWTAPEGNELNWGMLFRFSLVTNQAPDDSHQGDVTLAVAGPGQPSQYQARMMTPIAGAPPASFQVTAMPGRGGSIQPPVQQVAAGAAAGFSVVANPGYVVAAVQGDTCSPQVNGDGSWTAAMIQADCQVMASFRRERDLMFYDGFENGSGR